MKEDCFACGKKGCKILNDTYCEKEKCKFYMSQNDYETKKKQIEEKLKRSGYYDRQRKESV